MYFLYIKLFQQFMMLDFYLSAVPVLAQQQSNFIYSNNNKLSKFFQATIVSNMSTISQPGFKIRITNEKPSESPLFSQFKPDLKTVNVPKAAQNSKFLMTSVKMERKPTTPKSKNRKRMKLIDYIYIKNTSKKNQNASKSVKTQMSPNKLRKSRMKQGKEKAFKCILQQMVMQFKEVSAKAASMSEFVSQNCTYSGSTDEITKLCNIRRLLKDNILGGLAQIQKLMGVQENVLDLMTQQKINEQQEQDLDYRLKKLQFLGFQVLEDEPEERNLAPLTQRNLKVKNKISNKDTANTDRDSYRQNF